MSARNSKSQRRRPFEVVMEEAGVEALRWDLERHLTGCLAGYQADPTFASAVYFAFEAICGIVHDTESRAPLPQGNREWATDPRAKIAVDFFWLKAIAEAFCRYRDQGMPLGRAFGLEGGQGKSPTREKDAELKRVGSSLRGCCPIHHGSNRQQFVVNLNKNSWRCFGDCNRGGGSLELVAEIEQLALRDAALLIAQWFSITPQRCTRCLSPQLGRELINGGQTPYRLLRRNKSAAFGG